MKGYLIVFIFGVCALSLSTDLYRDIAQSNLQSYLRQPVISNFEAYYEELAATILLGGRYDSDEVCQHLRDQETEGLDIVQNFYYQSAAKLIDGCDVQVYLNPKDQLNMDDFSDYYHSAQLSHLVRDFIAFKEYCTQLPQFIGKEGAGKVKKNRSEDNYRIGAQVYYLASLCLAREENAALLEQIRLPIQTALLNIQELYQGVNAFPEREQSVTSTSMFIYAFNQIGLRNLTVQVMNEYNSTIVPNTIVGLLVAHLKVSGPAQQRYWVLRALQQKSVSPLVTPLLSNQKQRKRKEGSQVRITEFSFDLVQAKGEQPQFLHHVQDGILYPQTLKAKENTFLHARFKLTFEKGQTINPNQVALRLVHPQYPTVSFLVPTEYDSKRAQYYGILDFGDPEHVLPFNGRYKVELLIGDERLAQNKRWVFAEVETVFQTPTTKPPTHDSDYALSPLIYHQFQPPLPEIPVMFVSFFLVVIIIAFVFYLFMLREIGANTERLPTSPIHILLVYTFFGLLIAVFGVLGLFWVKLNLIETLTVLGTLAIPLVFVGNYALLSLRTYQNKQKRE